jgi:N5-methyltetrahydromethanopterin:coenzyme M methyltransferase subunit E
MTTVTMAHAFIAIFCTVTLCHLINAALGHPFPLPLLGLIWGIALGAAGSATGNPYYGKERQYQNQKFGAGVPISASGNIVRYAEAGERNSIDNGFFTQDRRFGIRYLFRPDCIPRTLAYYSLRTDKRRMGFNHRRCPHHPHLHGY